MTAIGNRHISPRRGWLAMAVLCAAPLLISCSTAPPQADAAKVMSSGADCAALSELNCIDSPECTLRQDGEHGYVCTPAASACELGFLQRGGRAEDCGEECVYSPARCYCSPDVTCICSGGPPSLCQDPADAAAVESGGAGAAVKGVER